MMKLLSLFAHTLVCGQKTVVCHAGLTITRPCLARAMGNFISSTVAQSLSVKLISQASLQVGIGPRGNIWDKIALHSFSVIPKRSALL